MRVVQLDVNVVHMDNTQALADLLPELIRKAGLTPNGLAVKAGIPRVTLRRHLVNPAALRLGEVFQIAQALDMKASTLLELAERPASGRSSGRRAA